MASEPVLSGYARTPSDIEEAHASPAGLPSSGQRTDSPVLLGSQSQEPVIRLDEFFNTMMKPFTCGLALGQFYLPPLVDLYAINAIHAAYIGVLVVLALDGDCNGGCYRGYSGAKFALGGAVSCYGIAAAVRVLFFAVKGALRTSESKSGSGSLSLVKKTSWESFEAAEQGMWQSFVSAAILFAALAIPTLLTLLTYVIAGWFFSARWGAFHTAMALLIQGGVGLKTLHSRHGTRVSMLAGAVAVGFSVAALVAIPLTK